MDNNTIDKLFREKIDKINDLPDNISWNKATGWKEYERSYSEGNKIKRAFLYISSAAAVVLLTLSLLLIQHREKNRIIAVHNNTPGVQEIVLPDNNRIWLNKGSIIEYPAKMDKNTEFNVTGEVYFEVSSLSNTRYIINANNAVISADKPCKVNIRAMQDEESVNVTISSGVVRIIEKNNMEGLTLLVPEGHYCSIHKSQNLAYSSMIRNNNYLAWKTGRLTFDSSPMATVTDILADYYNTRIELENKMLAYCLFSGTFERQPLEVILNQIQSELDVVIRNTGTGIIISGKECLIL
jgi:ferric-dicitrate binding protein FerR (iron transport regulator)